MFDSMNTENNNNNNNRWTDQTNLVVVVIQIGVSTLQLHHLDLSDPLLLFLSHQVTVGVPAAPVPPSPAAVPVWRWRDGEVESWRDGEVESWRDGLITDSVILFIQTLPYPPLFCIRCVSMRRCWGWRWVVLCRMGGVWFGGPWGGGGPILWPCGGGGPPKKGLKPPPPGNKGGAGPPRGNPATCRERGGGGVREVLFSNLSVR